MELISSPFCFLDCMEPLVNEAGEEAARKAATESAMATSLDDEGEVDADNAQAEVNDGAIKVVGNILEVVLLPFFLLYDLFVFVIGARLFQGAEIVFRFTKRQARSFLNGLKPYVCSATVTTVDIIVFCSIWYMFIDQAKLAFFPVQADNTLAVINFIVWCILTLELGFGVFIRPDDYSTLTRSDKAFTPTTVRYISGLHLAIEAFSLAFFVPEFLCLFQSDLACDERITFSFSYSTLLAISGPTGLESFAGRLFYACTRLRVFGLVRHWKNMWLNKKYLKRGRQKELEKKIRRADGDKSEKIQDESDMQHGVQRRQLVRLEQKQRDVALINASNIGTALMVTNSYRALTILVMIMGVFPMITLIFLNGVVNSAPNQMVAQLQSTNAMVTVENDANCEFLVDSVRAWASSWYYRDLNLITSSTEDFLISLILQPARCQDDFESLTVGEIKFVQSSCSAWKEHYELELGDSSSDDCIIGVLGGIEGDNLRSIEQNFDLRRGNLQIEQSQSDTDIMTLADGTSFETEFQVSACFNQSHAIEISYVSSPLDYFLKLQRWSVVFSHGL